MRVPKQATTISTPSVEDLKKEALAMQKHEDQIKQSHDELIVMIDCSGSMSHLVSDVVGGFNEMLRKTCTTKPNTICSFYKFNYFIETIVKAQPIVSVEPLKYFDVQGGTSLYGSIISVITENAIRIGKGKDPRSVTVAIFSDGEDSDHDSEEFNEAKDLIVEAQANGWNIEFYLMDSLSPEVAISLGVNPKQIKDASNISEAFLQIGQSK